MVEIIWPLLCALAVIGFFLSYVAYQEWISRNQYPDDQHEHGPFGR